MSNTDFQLLVLNGANVCTSGGIIFILIHLTYIRSLFNDTVSDTAYLIGWWWCSQLNLKSYPGIFEGTEGNH